MQNLTEPEQIVSVCDDIQHLIDNWRTGNIEERDIRAGSAILRRLLVYNELHKVWNALVGAEKFIIPTTRIVIDHDDLIRYYDLLSCTEVRHKMGTLFSLKVYTGVTKMVPVGEGNFKDETVYGAHIENAEMTLKQYMDSICIISEGRAITRNWAIQYVANSLGGAHFGSKVNKGPIYAKAMASLKKYDAGDMPVSVREVLGSAQAICRSESTERLMQAYGEWKKSNPHTRIA